MPTSAWLLTWRTVSPDPQRAAELREQILGLVGEYHDAKFGDEDFQPGESPIRFAGRVFDDREIVNLVDSSLEFWLTTGPWAAKFEKRFAKIFGLRHALLVNSGSSANLVALSCLTSTKLGAKRLERGDEVITCATGFPTTVNPIIQNGLVPVFVDVDVPTYNLDVSQLEEAVSPKTKAVMVAHTLGNPFDLDAVTAFCEKYDLWLVEDCCDALGSTYRDKPVGSFGNLASVSFYPAHHITMGEGGCVLTNKGTLKLLRRVVPRLGPRLLVRAGQRGHLRQALRPPARRAAARLRPQVHLLRRRLQPEADRHAGRRRARPARQARRFHRRPQSELPPPLRGPRRPPGAS